MSVNYKKLWKILVDKRINKTQLGEMTGLSKSTIAKLKKGENVNVNVLEKICYNLECQIGDIVEVNFDIKRKKRLNAISLFSGIGGFEAGINKSKIECDFLFSSEIDLNAQKSYLSNFKNNNLFGDITKINEKDIPNHDILFGGFPCQSFSIAGKQKGFEDTRGTLFFDVARILKFKKPKYFLLENVKNLVSHDDGKTFKTIISTLNNIGYTIDFTIINSCEAGLPQNRERTYIIGIYNYKESKIKEDKRNKVIDNFKKANDYKGFNFFNNLVFNNNQKYIIDILEANKEDRFLITNKNVESFLMNNDFNELTKKTNKIIKLFDLPKEIWNDLERQRRVYSIYGISPTILARSDTTKIFINDLEGKYIRKLTPKECFRAQGFEDEFIENILKSVSMTQQYKEAGNAVSPPVITGILNHLEEYING